MPAEKVKIKIGGFYLSALYKKNQQQVESELEQGAIDYADLTSWSLPDEFLCFVMQSQLFQFIDKNKSAAGRIFKVTTRR